MAIDCWCDYDSDPPDFYRVKIQRAKKTHKCYECSGTIIPGEQYEYVSGMWYGYMDIFKTCERCFDLRTWVKNNVPCFCWAHGNLSEDMQLAINDAISRAREETRGLKFAFLRKIVQRDRLNKERRQ